MAWAAHLALLVGGVLLCAFAFAKVEIQIEGPEGWAKSLPTWRSDHPLLRLLMGGREMTGYHAWALSFMAAIFHFPLAVVGAWSWTLEARCVGALMVFWVAEDLLWFVLNPAWGLRRFTRAEVTWHRRWIAGAPVEYWIFAPAGLALMAWSVGAFAV